MTLLTLSFKSLGLWDVVLHCLTLLLYAVTTFSQVHHFLGMMLTFPRGLQSQQGPGCVFITQHLGKVSNMNTGLYLHAGDAILLLIL